MTAPPSMKDGASATTTGAGGNESGSAITARIPCRNRQRGWFGLIVLLVALAIVAFLAKDALKQYGLLSGVGTERKAQASGERLRDPGVSQPSADTSSQPSPPATPIERARELEDTIKRQAQEQAKRIP